MLRLRRHEMLFNTLMIHLAMDIRRGQSRSDTVGGNVIVYIIVSRIQFQWQRVHCFGGREKGLSSSFSRIALIVQYDSISSEIRIALESLHFNR